MEFAVSKTVFSKETILKVVYAWQEKCSINISENQDNFVLSVSPKDGQNFDFDEFNSNLKEQQLREYLNLQFGGLRNAIYEKAFAHFKA